MNVYELATVRTNNFMDSEMATKIQQVWKEAQGKVTQQTTVYGVYHEFASDYRGDYTLSIASPVETGGKAIVIDSQANYQVFTVDTTKEMAVFKTWQKIWALEEEGKLTRAYKADYEKYQEGSIEILIEVVSL